ncbi:MAG: sugar transferase [Chloroflexia bacterium]
MRALKTVSAEALDYDTFLILNHFRQQFAPVPDLLAAAVAISCMRTDMSLVGPRPPTPDEADKYDDRHRKRLDVTPGLTGLWQVSGRSDLSFEEMVKLDLYYAENWSPAMDLRIILKTIPSWVRGEGAY